MQGFRPSPEALSPVSRSSLPGSYCTICARFGTAGKRAVIHAPDNFSFAECRIAVMHVDLMAACGKAENFLPSTGCDVPYAAPWENIEAFFAAVEEAQA